MNSFSFFFAIEAVYSKFDVNYLLMPASLCIKTTLILVKILAQQKKPLQ